MTDGFGKYEVYATADSMYCYPGTSVLRNHFGLEDAAKLKELETDISAIRQNDLLMNPIKGKFSATHLCAIHKYLLEDVYPFAGHYRREDIAKGTTRFLPHGEVKHEVSGKLKQLADEKWLAGLPFDAYIERAAYYFAELNYIHPFREGNGRALREFMRQLFIYSGYEVNWGAVPTETLLDAMIESVFDTKPLVAVLKQCLTELNRQ